MVFPDAEAVVDVSSVERQDVSETREKEQFVNAVIYYGINACWWSSHGRSSDLSVACIIEFKVVVVHQQMQCFQDGFNGYALCVVFVVTKKRCNYGESMISFDVGVHGNSVTSKQGHVFSVKAGLGKLLFEFEGA